MSIKITLGLLSNRGFKNETVVSLLNMINYSRHYEWTVLMSPNGYTIAENRNWLSAQAVKSGADWLLMIDDDMVFPPNTAEILVNRDKDIIGIPYHVKVFPKETHHLREPDAPPLSKTEPNEVLAIGTGISLFKVNIFKEIPQPHFGFDIAKNGMVLKGEDYYFCKKALDKGYKIYVEPAESFYDKEGKDLLGHIGDFKY